MDAPACHRALRVTEILYEIAHWYSQHSRSGRAMVRLALVCQTFSAVSIDVWISLRFFFTSELYLLGIMERIRPRFGRSLRSCSNLCAAGTSKGNRYQQTLMSNSGAR